MQVEKGSGGGGGGGSDCYEVVVCPGLNRSQPSSLRRCPYLRRLGSAETYESPRQFPLTFCNAVHSTWHAAPRLQAADSSILPLRKVLDNEACSLAEGGGAGGGGEEEVTVMRS